MDIVVLKVRCFLFFFWSKGAVQLSECLVLYFFMRIFCGLLLFDTNRSCSFLTVGMKICVQLFRVINLTQHMVFCYILITAQVGT